jgi:hypothetical protein
LHKRKHLLGWDDKIDVPSSYRDDLVVVQGLLDGILDLIRRGEELLHVRRHRELLSTKANGLLSDDANGSVPRIGKMVQLQVGGAC